MKTPPAKPSKAVIYCRVSSDRQAKEGSGLQSQETRCREYAEKNSYKVIRAFKDEGVSGNLGPDNRPAAKELFAFLDTQKERFVVIVDDVSRVARSQQAYLDFQLRLTARGAMLASPGHSFGTKPIEKFVTEIAVSHSSLQREINQEQVLNRQKARLQNGYWLFGKPLGYRYVKDVTGGGKIMVRDEPKATILAEALEGFAAGRFEAQADVAHFMTLSGAFGKRFHTSRVRKLLTNILFTGYIEYPEWGVTLREGKQPALISIKTYEKIQERLGLRAKAPYRKDLNSDFPLRGFVLCADCQEPLTGAFSTSRDKTKHPYYRCKKKGCDLYGKGIKRAYVEDALETVLDDMRPSEPVLDLAKAIVKDVWAKKRGEHSRQLSGLDREVKDLDQQITGFMARLLEPNKDKAVIDAYENHVAQLQKQRHLLSAQTSQMYSIDTSYDSALGTIFDFIGNPLSIWTNGDLEDKRLVLKLAFAKKLPFSKEKGFGTALTSLPFTTFRGLSAEKIKMVEEEGFEPSYS